MDHGWIREDTGQAPYNFVCEVVAVGVIRGHIDRIVVNDVGADIATRRQRTNSGGVIGLAESFVLRRRIDGRKVVHVRLAEWVVQVETGVIAEVGFVEVFGRWGRATGRVITYPVVHDDNQGCRVSAGGSVGIVRRSGPVAGFPGVGFVVA